MSDIKHNIKTVGVVGAGTMGQGIVHIFAHAGFNVLCFDAMDGAVDKAIGRIGKFLDKAVDKGKMSTSDKASTIGRIKPCGGLGDFSSADIVIEAATEKPDIKSKIFGELNTILPDDRILATNTSSISINSLAESTGRPAKFIGMHFFNPVPLMGLVEIITGQATDSATIDTTVELARAVGKEPLQCKDSPGFVSNRVGMLMINEAAYCLHDAIATPEAIDGIMKLGFNHPMGPLALADLIGIDVCLFIMEVLHRDFGNDKYLPCPLLKEMVGAGRLGKKAGKGFYDYG